MRDEEFIALLTAQERAATATPRLQGALLGVALAAAALAAASAVLFSASSWVDAESARITTGNPDNAEWISSTYAWTVAALVFLAALLVAGGSRIDVGARVRYGMMTIGAVLMVTIGGLTPVRFNPSRDGLRHYYHVGEVASSAAFAHWVYPIDVIAVLIAGCGVTALVLGELQRRRVAAAYPA